MSGYSEADNTAWLEEAACADADWQLFFVEAGHAISNEAKDMCVTCPVRQECLRQAYRQQLIAGYFGGLSPSQRKRMTLEEALTWQQTQTLSTDSPQNPQDTPGAA